jgi:hypothetical protein
LLVIIFAFLLFYFRKTDFDLKLKAYALSLNKFKQFLDCINDVINCDEFLKIDKNFSRSRFFNFAGSIICLFLIIGFIILSINLNLFSPDETSLSGFLPAWVLLLGFSLIVAVLIILGIRFLVRGLLTVHSIKKYDTLMFHINNFSSLESFFEKWNVDLFIPYGIYVSCPVNLEYLQFNMDPFKDIELENHEFRG